MKRYFWHEDGIYPDENGDLVKFDDVVAARCNDTAPVAPIGDAKLDAIANDHFTDGNHLTTHQWRSYARAVLAAVAAQGAK